ncbi:MAG: fumarylacetoacetate hydrolase family protein [Gammaproteobacteria bacterium]|nr:fumarylacetoacetate hydrolase family protein [Gammaproteobacteria bacterium]
MRFLSFSAEGQTRFGAIVEDRVVDLSERMSEYASLRHVISAGALVRAQDIAIDASSDFSLKQIDFLPTITDPQKIVCIGINYGKRDAEYTQLNAPPKYPSVFMRTRESLVGHQQPILRPPESDQLDYEGEIALIIGKAGRRIPQEKAIEHIAGLSLINEGSVRDWMRHGTFNVTQGKNFERSGAQGPWMVTVDEFSSLDNLELTCRVNGDVRQQDSTMNLLFSFRYLISYLSTFMRLQPGDIISTGTPTGSGARLEPPEFLVAGDVIEVEVPEIGILRNKVVDEVPEDDG